MDQENESIKTKKKKGSKFLANNKYFTICVYSIIVIFFAAVIFSLITSWNITWKNIGKALRVLMPFIIGGLIAYVLNPAVTRFYRFFQQKCHIKNVGLCKTLAILISYALVIGIITITLFGVLPQIVSSITDLINFIPTAVQQIYHFFDTIEERFPSIDMDILRKTINDAIPHIISYAKDFATNMIPALYSVSMSIFKWVLNLIIAVIVSIYMLADKRPLINSCKAVVYAFVPIRYIALILEVAAEANRLFSSFIVGKAIDSSIIGIICFFVMTILRLPYTILISVIVGITNMIPYFGPFIGAVPGAIILLFISPVKTVIFIIMIFALQQFDGLILGPKILGNSTGLKPLWIIFAITVGGSIAGVLGMFLGVPTVAFIRYLINRLINHQLRKRDDALPEHLPPLE